MTVEGGAEDFEIDRLTDGFEWIPQFVETAQLDLMGEKAGLDLCHASSQQTPVLFRS